MQGAGTVFSKLPETLEFIPPSWVQQVLNTGPALAPFLLPANLLLVFLWIWHRKRPDARRYAGFMWWGYCATLLWLIVWAVAAQRMLVVYWDSVGR